LHRATFNRLTQKAVATSVPCSSINPFNQPQANIFGFDNNDSTLGGNLNQKFLTLKHFFCLFIDEAGFLLYFRVLYVTQPPDFEVT
jgi:hypothetical protein